MKRSTSILPISLIVCLSLGCGSSGAEAPLSERGGGGAAGSAASSGSGGSAGLAGGAGHAGVGGNAGGSGSAGSSSGGTGASAGAGGNAGTAGNAGAGGADGPSPYLEPVHVPSCDTSNPEVQHIATKDDWNKINDPDKRIFCVAPGDYRSLGAIELTTSGTEDQRRYIVLDNGNDTHPAKLPEEQVANYALMFKQASYWVVDRLAAISPTKTSRVVDLQGAKESTPGSGSTHNILNRLFAHDMGCAVRFGTDGDSNTLQNSRIEDMRLNSLKKDVMAVIIEDNIYGTPSVTITNTKILDNEIVNTNDGIHVGRHAYTADGGTRQHGNIAGTIIDGNDIYITPSIYTDGAGNLDPNGTHAYAENAMDIKIGSESAANPVIVSNNRMWGYRRSDTTDSSIGSNGYAFILHFGVDNIQIVRNVAFDSAGGIGAADKRDEPYAMQHALISENLIVDCGGLSNGSIAVSVMVSQSAFVDASENVVIRSRNPVARLAHDGPGVCFGENVIVAQDQDALVVDNEEDMTACLASNAVYETEDDAGYTGTYSFTTDQLTNDPRVIAVPNARHE